MEDKVEKTSSGAFRRPAWEQLETVEGIEKKIAGLGESTKYIQRTQINQVSDAEGIERFTRKIGRPALEKYSGSDLLSVIVQRLYEKKNSSGKGTEAYGIIPYTDQLGGATTPIKRGRISDEKRDNSAAIFGADELKAVLHQSAGFPPEIVNDALETLSGAAQEQGLKIRFAIEAIGGAQLKDGTQSASENREMRRVSDLPEFRKHAAQKQWENRKTLGYGYRTDVFHFIREVYGSWIDRAQNERILFSQADLLSVDEALWKRLQRSRNQIPDDLYLPTEKEATFAHMTPSEQRERRIMREVWKRNSAEARKMKRK